MSTSSTSTTPEAMTIGSGTGNSRLYCYVGTANTVYVVLVIGASDITLDTDTAFDADANLASSLAMNIAVYGDAVP
jgi:hypothetical protein